MELKDYKKEVLRTAKSFDTMEKNIFHMMLGFTGEIGEIADIFKQHYIYGKKLDIEHLIEEFGDVIYYIIFCCMICDIDFENEVLDKNVKKLKVRYPDGFSNERALNRDLDKEKEALNELLIKYK